MASHAAFHFGKNRLEDFAKYSARQIPAPIATMKKRKREKPPVCNVVDIFMAKKN
jgi:hypothetical protein